MFSQRIPISQVMRHCAGVARRGNSIDEVLRQSLIGARYVDRILKGTKPAELPIQQPTKFDLVINLKTANRIGVAIPQSVLDRADRLVRSSPSAISQPS